MSIALLIGGHSTESQVSIASGQAVAQALEQLKTRYIPVFLDQKNNWHQATPAILLNHNTDLGQNSLAALVSQSQATTPQQIANKTNLAFIAMHGTVGEDGSLQGLLENIGLPYTGSGILASSLGMDKHIFRILMQGARLPIPPSILLTNDQIPADLNSIGPPPYIVKPHNQGSSVGITQVNRGEDLPQAIQTARHYSPITLIDKFISGTEITAAVMGNDSPQALPLVEIVPAAHFFDYNSKYLDSQTQEIVPARISKQLTTKIQSLALDIYQLLGCRGYARVDFIIDNHNHPYILEINTLPGLTPVSLLPKAAQAHGLNYPSLIQKIINFALQN